MVFDIKLLDILACPVCKGKLSMGDNKHTLVCRFDRLAYPVRDGIPVLIEAEAQTLSQESQDNSR
ncbi:Trm112 family protein [Alteromonas lipotrueiana]|uniref:Trm112 family protein n=1 Tax=Alteromonas lipotrueiana TaxID=2803815 RepID=UPI001C4458E1|nr:Trm112 family protein [Alteromonas lipotrueiana]